MAAAAAAREARAAAAFVAGTAAYAAGVALLSRAVRAAGSLWPWRAGRAGGGAGPGGDKPGGEGGGARPRPARPAQLLVQGLPRGLRANASPRAGALICAYVCPPVAAEGALAVAAGGDDCDAGAFRLYEVGAKTGLVSVRVALIRIGGKKRRGAGGKRTKVFWVCETDPSGRAQTRVARFNALGTADESGTARGALVHTDEYGRATRVALAFGVSASALRGGRGSAAKPIKPVAGLAGEAGRGASVLLLVPRVPQENREPPPIRHSSSAPASLLAGGLADGPPSPYASASPSWSHGRARGGGDPRASPGASFAAAGRPSPRRVTSARMEGGWMGGDEAAVAARSFADGDPLALASALRSARDADDEDGGGAPTMAVGVGARPTAGELVDIFEGEDIVPSHTNLVIRAARVDPATLEVSTAGPGLDVREAGSAQPDGARGGAGRVLFAMAALARGGGHHAVRYAEPLDAASAAVLAKAVIGAAGAAKGWGRAKAATQTAVRVLRAVNASSGRADAS